MRNLLKILFVSLALFVAGDTVKAQDKAQDIFVPISKYFSQGNVESLSAWFDDNLEINILSQGANASRNQARQMLKSFFDKYTPRSFEITHTAGRANMKYALGTLNAGGENFLVTIFISAKDESFHIQQPKIERVG